MAEDSKIQWTTHTWNPWEGCAKVSPGCANCYAEARDKRFTGGKFWGPKAERRVVSAKLAREPLRWQRDAEQQRKAAEALGLPPPPRPRVFVASLADVFEHRADLAERRLHVFRTIQQCPDLDFLLLTKRPHEIAHLWPSQVPPPSSSWWPNVWLGCTAENQEWANKRMRHLLKVPAVVHFASLEPLLGPVDLGEAIAIAFADGATAALDWAIIGGESGSHARPFELAWARSLLTQCERLLIAPFVKQLGSAPRQSTDEALVAAGIYPADTGARGRKREPLKLSNAKGGDMSEWPPDLRVREFPRGFPR